MNLKPVPSVLVAAVLFGVSTPLAKILLGDISPVALAGLLYLGVFAGLGVAAALRKTRAGAGLLREAPLEKKDIPWLAGAVLAGGVAGPIALLMGLSQISGFSASLLLNFEGVATAAIAVLVFRENAGRRLWTALALMTAAGVLLSWNTAQGRISPLGPALVVAAMICWGIDNNLTRHISDKDPVQIARIKGLAAGIVSTAAAFAVGRGFRPGAAAAYGLLVGAVCYGLSLILFIRALKGLGAFRTGVYFGFAPFIGSVASIALLGDRVRWSSAAAGALMLGGVLLLGTEKHGHAHSHPRTVHAHAHSHGDLHHGHTHSGPVTEPHSHVHTHEEVTHAHGHWPDTHHRHGHSHPPD